MLSNAPLLDVPCQCEPSALPLAISTVQRHPARSLRRSSKSGPGSARPAAYP
ncbi:hypothetical protein HETIRDRAFT_415374 [Heterobasidion irregulare TC 32-1]|uniref:Uncharacterized protein n=1 Tax=Heterobasidion irregulare (strain TC 32-1) TaxID=747525 RepID=W4KCX8_HETIT|nr:uncharacterized protein HETIRDRAFT_415374 [Heterobasidion irregulare TC 32-1]ETW83594.1 hypothetical protein HETIRDRAFT_415374 [Heterobasidion irregulare TC 32-1]